MLCGLVYGRLMWHYRNNTTHDWLRMWLDFDALRATRMRVSILAEAT